MAARLTTASWTLFTGVAVDSAGNVYITDTVFNLGAQGHDFPNGYISTIVGINGTGGALNHPNALLVDSTGAIYIADTSHHDRP